MIHDRIPDTTIDQWRLKSQRARPPKPARIRTRIKGVCPQCGRERVFERVTHPARPGESVITCLSCGFQEERDASPEPPVQRTP